MKDEKTPAPTVRWSFVRRRGVADIWFWQRTGAGGLLEAVSDGHHGLGKALVDAVKSGFDTATHPWLISDAEWTTSFEQGHRPRSVQREPSTIPGGPHPSTIQSESTELGPCPQCGKRAGKLKEIGGGRLRFYVDCEACMFMTTLARTEGIAAKLWNEAKPATK